MCVQCVRERERGREREREREREGERQRVKARGREGNGRLGLGQLLGGGKKPHCFAALFCIEVSAQQAEIGRESKASPDKARCYE
jgi:hypothetical protein